MGRNCIVLVTGSVCTQGRVEHEGGPGSRRCQLAALLLSSKEGSDGAEAVSKRLGHHQALGDPCWQLARNTPSAVSDSQGREQRSMRDDDCVMMLMMLMMVGGSTDTRSSHSHRRTNTDTDALTQTQTQTQTRHRRTNTDTDTLTQTQTQWRTHRSSTRMIVA